MQAWEEQGMPRMSFLGDTGCCQCVLSQVLLYLMRGYYDCDDLRGSKQCLLTHSPTHPFARSPLLWLFLQHSSHVVCLCRCCFT